MSTTDRPPAPPRWLDIDRIQTGVRAEIDDVCRRIGDLWPTLVDLAHDANTAAQQARLLHGALRMELDGFAGDTDLEVWDGVDALLADLIGTDRLYRVFAFLSEVLHGDAITGSNDADEFRENALKAGEAFWGPAV